MPIYLSAALIILTGIAAGFLGGAVGIGGGIVVIPCLVLLLGFSQHLAQGTSLAMMLPPIGILAVMTYHRQGFVDWRAGALLCIGFLVGSFFGSKFATALPEAVMTRLFGGFLAAVGIRMLLKG